MAQSIVMPKLGLTMTEGTIVRWIKKEGDPVASGDGLFEVETDKLTNTVQATADGTLLKITAQEGSRADCFATVAFIGAQGEAIPDLAATEATEAKGAQTTAASATVATAPPSLPAVASSGGRILASPAAKKLAKEKGVDLSLVVPSESGKPISLKDIEAYLAKPTARVSGLAKKMAAEAGLSLDGMSSMDRILSADVSSYVIQEEQKMLEEKVRMSGMRRVIAKRMRESQDISPTVAMDISVDVTAMKGLKNDLAEEGIKVSYTDILVKVVASLLMESPLLNCSVEGDQIVFKHYANVGVAVALKEGLIVPVVKNAHKKKIKDISREIKNLAEDARNGTLHPDDMSGGTFTITNLGMFGVESFTPIINQPEVAILGVNAIIDTPVVVNGAVVIRPIMKLSLVIDHRAIDGAVGAQFLAKLKRVLEKPALLLL